MIDTSMCIRCDGVVDEDDELCEAEFTMDDISPVISPIRVAFQLAQRGWTIKQGPQPYTLLTLCPLHREGQ